MNLASLRTSLQSNKLAWTIGLATATTVIIAAASGGGAILGAKVGGLLAALYYVLISILVAVLPTGKESTPKQRTTRWLIGIGVIACGLAIGGLAHYMNLQSASEGAWKMAKSLDTAESYATFISDYPNSKVQSEAESLLRQRRLDFVLASKNAEAMKKYIELYPNDSTTDKVKQALLTATGDLAKSKIDAVNLAILQITRATSLSGSVNMSSKTKGLVEEYSTLTQKQGRAKNTRSWSNEKDGQRVKIMPDGNASVTFSEPLPGEIIFTAGEIGLDRFGDFFVAEGTEVSLDGHQYSFSSGQWKRK